MAMIDEITRVVHEVHEMLIEKNKAYGNSAADPIRVFSKTNTIEQINVRIDDKLSRIARGHEYGTDDTELDLIGYLILKRATKRFNASGCTNCEDCDCDTGCGGNGDRPKPRRIEAVDITDILETVEEVCDIDYTRSAECDVCEQLFGYDRCNDLLPCPTILEVIQTQELDRRMEAGL
jgi:hypothetical protein